MSHRRGGGPKEAIKNSDQEMIPFNESLDLSKPTTVAMDRDAAGATEDNNISKVPNLQQQAPASLSLDDRYETENLNVKHKLWKEGPFAAGLCEPTWADEYAKFKANPSQECMNTTGPDGVPCICCSAYVCNMIGAGRVGNFAVIKQSTEWVEEVETDGDETPKVRRFTRPRLDIVVGPYWPMLCCVTYPLILGVSGVTLFAAIPGKHPLVILAWVICTGGLIYSLAMTAFRDPGILPRYEKPPLQNDNGVSNFFVWNLVLSL
jgi:hypothetical protein